MHARITTKQYLDITWDIHDIFEDPDLVRMFISLYNAGKEYDEIISMGICQYCGYDNSEAEDEKTVGLFVEDLKSTCPLVVYQKI